MMKIPGTGLDTASFRADNALTAPSHSSWRQKLKRAGRGISYGGFNVVLCLLFTRCPDFPDDT
jgi:hypothetical protein